MGLCFHYFHSVFESLQVVISTTPHLTEHIITSMQLTPKYVIGHMDKWHKIPHIFELQLNMEQMVWSTESMTLPAELIKCVTAALEASWILQAGAESAFSSG